MKKLLLIITCLALFMAGCGQAVPTPLAETATPLPSATPMPPTLTPTPEASPTPLYPPEGVGPENYGAEINPLTGLGVSDPTLLDRRPLSIKVNNERGARPQWGLSLADIVFEYYNQEGSSRFNAIFYGQNADQVGPVRSARFFDEPVVRGYDAVFAFGSAYSRVYDRLFSQEFSNRLVLEWYTNSGLTRYDPNGSNYLMANTTAVSAYATANNVENGRQDLAGMFFKMEAPDGGTEGASVFVRFSGATYSRWDYDAASGKYLRFADTLDDYSRLEQGYAQMTDRLTDLPISAANVVVLLVPYEYYDVSGDVVRVNFTGTGDAYAYRDGLYYQVKWQRGETDVVSLTFADGTPFPFKPGNTWFEVIGTSSTIEPTDEGLYFTHRIP